MTEPIVAQKEPVAVEVTEGEKYWWCACGKSKSQPFCDGSHKGSEFTPVKYVADKSRRMFFCACKQSTRAPMCDGSHKEL